MSNYKKGKKGGPYKHKHGFYASYHHFDDFFIEFVDRSRTAPPEGLLFPNFPSIAPLFPSKENELVKIDPAAAAKDQFTISLDPPAASDLAPIVAPLPVTSPAFAKCPRGALHGIPIGVDVKPVEDLVRHYGIELKAVTFEDVNKGEKRTFHIIFDEGPRGSTFAVLASRILNSVKIKVISPKVLKDGECPAAAPTREEREVQLAFTLIERLVDPLHTLLSEPEEYYSYTGDIEVASTEAEVEVKLSKLLRGNPVTAFTESSPLVVGMDIEWVPNQLPGQSNPVALLQLYNGYFALLIRLNLLRKEFYESHRLTDPFEVPPLLAQFLSHRGIFKVGLAIGEDARKLEENLKGLTLGGVIDVQKFPVHERIRPRSLGDLIAIFFHVRLPKDQDESNWETPHLSRLQLEYGASDAWASYLVFWKLATLPYEFNLWMRDVNQLFWVRKEPKKTATPPQDSSSISPLS